MSREIDNWLKRVKRVFEALPEGFEAAIGYCSISVYQEGTMDKHLENDDTNGWGIDHELEEGSIQFDGRVTPYSEGS